MRAMILQTLKVTAVDKEELWFVPDGEAEVELAALEALAVREAEL